MTRKLLALFVALLAIGGVAISTASAKSETGMGRFLTAVTKDVDAYWTQTLGTELQVRYGWIPAGRTLRSACGPMGDDTAAYCPADDTIYIAERFATGIFTGSLNRALPGSSRGFGRTYGDFAVAYIVAHEYAHQVQDELGLYARFGNRLPTSAFELQADCLAGTWANNVYQRQQLDEGDVEEAIDAALAVGDFDAGSPGHHGTPEQRARAWYRGFRTGDPSACGYGAR